MCVLYNEIIAHYRCKRAQHWLRMKDRRDKQIQNLVNGLIATDKQTLLDQQKEGDTNIIIIILIKQRWYQ